MDQNEEIIVPHGNHVGCQKIMRKWMASEAYWSFRSNHSLGSVPIRFVCRPGFMLPK